MTIFCFCGEAEVGCAGKHGFSTHSCVGFCNPPRRCMLRPLLSASSVSQICVVWGDRLSGRTPLFRKRTPPSPIDPPILENVHSSSSTRCLLAAAAALRISHPSVYLSTPWAVVRRCVQIPPIELAVLSLPERLVPSIVLCVFGISHSVPKCVSVCGLSRLFWLCRRATCTVQQGTSRV